MGFVRQTFAFMVFTLVAIGVSPQRLPALPPEESPAADDQRQEDLVTQKLTPFATATQRPKEWFFWQDDASGNFTWIISKEEVGEADQEFGTGVEIKAFYDVSKNNKKTPEDYAAEYLKTSVKSEGMKVLHRAKQKAGPLTALTQTVELSDEILATDLYWGDGKQLDVVVVVKRKAPKKQWNASQRLFQKLTRFNLRAIVLRTRETPQNGDGKNSDTALPK